MTINPFEIFGIVDPNRISVKDLKKIYYEFAMLVHPDRNGGGSGDEMRVLHMAYLYCREQIENAESRKVTFECLEKEFDDFCRLQKEQPPCFRDIMEDALELRRFNEEFESSNEIFRASYCDGYGQFMETSSCCNNEYSPILPSSQLQSNSVFNSIIVYKEPIAFNNMYSNDSINTQSGIEKIENFTKILGRMCLSDYMEANSQQHIEDIILPSNKTYEQILEERKNI